MKIRGFRVELGEIEASLALHESVKAAAVVARTHGPNDKSLVAYVVPSDLAEVHIPALRNHLRAALPEYMQPSAFVVLSELPLTSTGKLDRRALPEPDLESYASREYEPPVGETEHMLAALWRAVLRIERVGRDDSFFELGGNSLTAMQLVARIHAASSVEMPVRALFEEPTLRRMSCRLDEIRIASLAAQRDAEEAAMQEMLARVAAMPDSEVQALLRELTTEGRP